MEKIIRKNFCDFCKNKCGNGCLSIEIVQSDNFITYRCLNYQNDAPLEPFKKFIKYDYYDEQNNYIVIIKPQTPKETIAELRKRYDYVRQQA